MRVAIRNFLFRLIHGRACDDARDAALANAAMVAYDIGRPDIRREINNLIPVNSRFKPCDQ